jgi:N-acetylglucosaminyldiphosphoundecaprenol N-acetyl-beta-D-mannosaminyltransferase
MTTRRENLLGVGVDVVDYDVAVSRIIDSARTGMAFSVTALAVHGLMIGARDRSFAAVLGSLDLVAPDGQPVRWALNLLYHAGLSDRVYGPELTARVVASLSEADLPLYLYGSTDSTLLSLRSTLCGRHPELTIAGAEASKFRRLTEQEVVELAGRINDSGARCVLVGLGCPRQEAFVAAMSPLLDMPLLAVGAAFDYHAGNLRKPPEWMQRFGLEWLWRLILEPRRLWRRYLLLNPAFVAMLLRQFILGGGKPVPTPDAYRRPSRFDG